MDESLKQAETRQTLTCDIAFEDVIRIALAQTIADLVAKRRSQIMTRGGGRGGSAGGGRNNVGFVKPQEPKFLREIKEKVTEKKTPRFEYLEGGIQGG